MGTTKRISFRVFILFVFSITALNCNRGITPGVLRFSHFWSEPAQRAAMDSLLAGFHREHPEIPIEVTELSWADGKTKLMAGFNSETAPDVLELGSDWVAQFSSERGAHVAGFRGYYYATLCECAGIRIAIRNVEQSLFCSVPLAAGYAKSYFY